MLSGSQLSALHSSFSRLVGHNARDGRVNLVGRSSIASTKVENGQNRRIGPEARRRVECGRLGRVAPVDALSRDVCREQCSTIGTIFASG
jgi:hypothetical protein